MNFLKLMKSSGQSPRTRREPMLTELFCSGLAQIRRNVPMAAVFGMSQEQWNHSENTDNLQAFIDVLPDWIRTAPDQLFSAMHFGMANGFDVKNGSVTNLVKLLAEKKYPRKLFQQSNPKFNIDRRLDSELKKWGNHFAMQDDLTLKTAIIDQFDISFRSLLSVPKDSNFSYTKINHGYWEHLLSIYAECFQKKSAADEFRKLNPDSHSMRYAESGFNDLLAHLIRLHFDSEVDGNELSGNRCRLAISFNAGEAQHKLLLRRPLVQVTRGAMAGALAFFKAIDESGRIALGDGAEAKSLIDSREAHALVQACVQEESAVLFVVPPHLRNITIRGMNNPVHRLIIPGSLAHETWRVGLPMFTAMARRLTERYKNVVIISQAAVLASVFGLSLFHLNELSAGGCRVRFFDLGRVLDVVCPDIVSNQGWFGRYLGVPPDQLSPFELSPDTNDRSIIYGEILNDEGET